MLTEIKKNVILVGLVLVVSLAGLMFIVIEVNSLGTSLAIIGTTIHRPEFEKILQMIRSDDTLIITKLDRFARNTREALEIIQDLFSKGVKINILNMGIIDNTPTGQLTFTIFSAFAQFERDMILTRTREGKNYARENDPLFKEGRPLKYSKEQIEFARELRQQGMTYRMIERKTGISVATLKRRFQ